MADQDGDSTPSHSDQEDLMPPSDLEDLTDLEEMHFAYSKTHTDNSTDTEPPILWKPKLHFVLIGLALLASSFSVIILHPLYWQQLKLSSKDVNILSGLVFVSVVGTAVVWILTLLSSWVWKWDIRLLTPPLGCKRMCAVGLTFGAGATLVTLGGSRVPCHLQDPLKAITMLFSLVFYFFFCRKVMGLQRIFSATTAVVGLFISVDYGLCDDYRCRGYEESQALPLEGGSVDHQQGMATKHSPHSGYFRHGAQGWEERFAWTMVYVIGLAFWTLHLTLLETHILTNSLEATNTPLPPTLLSTVSRLVSHSEPLMTNMEPHYPRAPLVKKSPHTLHLAAWIHLIGLACVIAFSWIDMLPTNEELNTPTQYWKRTQQGLACYFQMSPQSALLPKQMEYLSNLTPLNAEYNRTVHSIRRKKRSSDDLYFRMNYEEYLQRAGVKHRTSKNKNHNMVHHAPNNQTPMKTAHLIMKLNDKCELIRLYGWVFTLVYVVFVFALVGFLVLSESAVFTVAIITAALPIAGLYWAIFELVPQGNGAAIELGPSVTGELICSLLGLPIVLLGVVLLCRAQFRDLQRSDYSSLENRVA